MSSKNQGPAGWRSYFLKLTYIHLKLDDNKKFKSKTVKIVHNCLHFAVIGVKGRTEGSSLGAVTCLLSGTVARGCPHLTVAKVSMLWAGFPAVPYVFQKLTGFGVYTMPDRVALLTCAFGLCCFSESTSFM